MNILYLGGPTVEKQARIEELKQLRAQVRNIDKDLRPRLTLITSGLAGVNIIILQSFISGGKLDIPSTISVYALAIAIPMLAHFIVRINTVKSLWSLLDNSKGTLIALIIGILSSLVGLSAAFYHISWIACVIFVASSVAAYLLFLGRDVVDPLMEEDPLLDEIIE